MKVGNIDSFSFTNIEIIYLYICALCIYGHAYLVIRHLSIISDSRSLTLYDEDSISHYRHRSWTSMNRFNSFVWMLRMVRHKAVIFFSLYIYIHAHTYTHNYSWRISVMIRCAYMYASDSSVSTLNSGFGVYIWQSSYHDKIVFSRLYDRFLHCTIEETLTFCVILNHPQQSQIWCVCVL